MASPPRNRAGVLVLRAWVEPTPEGMLRSRITWVIDTEKPHQESFTTISIDAACEQVRDWLESFLELNRLETWLDD